MAYTTFSVVITGDLWTASSHNLLTGNFDHLTELAEVPLSISEAKAPLSGVDAAALDLSESSVGNTEKPVFSRLLFDDSTDEARIWEKFIPRIFGATPVFSIDYYMAGANTDDEVVIDVLVAAVSDGDSSFPAKGFDTKNSVTETVPNAAGEFANVQIALANFDSAAAGDYVQLMLRRDADNGSDTAAGDWIVKKATFLWNLV